LEEDSEFIDVIPCGDVEKLLIREDDEKNNMVACEFIDVIPCGDVEKLLIREDDEKNNMVASCKMAGWFLLKGNMVAVTSLAVHRSVGSSLPFNM